MSAHIQSTLPEGSVHTLYYNVLPAVYQHIFVFVSKTPDIVFLCACSNTLAHSSIRRLFDARSCAWCMGDQFNRRKRIKNSFRIQQTPIVISVLLCFAAEHLVQWAYGDYPFLCVAMHCEQPAFDHRVISLADSRIDIDNRSRVPRLNCEKR
jgi:hypothetical protein